MFQVRRQALEAISLWRELIAKRCKGATHKLESAVVRVRLASPRFGSLSMFGSLTLSSRRLAFHRAVHLVVLAAVALSSVLVKPRTAVAQSEADRATARNLAAEGYTALKMQDYSTAEDRFRRADVLVHAPTLVLDHARALMGLGRLVEAQERLELVLREGVPDNSPWSWKKAATDASALIAEVKPRVAWLTINVVGPKEPLVLVDGAPVASVTLGVRRATDPGKRRVSATAQGFLPKEVVLELPDGGERAVTLDLDVDPSFGRTAQAPDVKRVAAPNRSNPPRKKTKTLAYVSLGLGGVGLATGAVTGIISLGARSDLKSQCGGNVCPPGAPEYKSLHDKYVTYSIVSGVSFGVGIAATAVGVWQLLSSDPAPAQSTSTQQARTVSLLPYATTDGLGVLGAF